jgi:hypothetical protein
MLRNFKKLKEFDAVTRFRLINAFIIAAGMNLLYPVLADLKGEYLVAWIISAFMIIETLAVKTNRYFVDNFSLSQVYKLSVFAHINFTLVAGLYFWNPLYMIYGDMIAAILDVSIFSAFSIMLINYLTNNYPESMNEFQIVRNSIWADGILLGLIVVTGVTYFFGNSVAIILFLGFNTCFSGWLIWNWKFYDNIKSI